MVGRTGPMRLLRHTTTMGRNVRPPSNKDHLIVGNITLPTGRTSIKLSFVEWQALRHVCQSRNMSLDDFCAEVEADPARTERSRTMRIRAAVLLHLLQRLRVDIVAA
ncbi:MAG: ribbon-helix-helix domain-containing protein [Acetobacterales bacterium]